MTFNPSLPRLLMLVSLVSALKMSHTITHGLEGIFTLRTFAIYQNNWVVLSILAILGISRTVLDIVRISIYVSVLQHYSWDCTVWWFLSVNCSENAFSTLIILIMSSISIWNCYKVQPLFIWMIIYSYAGNSTEVGIRATQLSYWRNILFAAIVAETILVLVFDTIVFILTIYKTWSLFKEWKAITKHWKDSLASVLIHDGVFHHSYRINIWHNLARNYLLQVNQS